MPTDSPAQAIARGLIRELNQNPSPLELTPDGFAVVAQILNGFTGALATAAGITITPIPDNKQLFGKVVLTKVQSQMLKAMLVEFVAVPTGQG